MSEYFSHDYNARNDLNMKKLFMGEGLSGIGLYWCLVEMLYEKNGYIDLDYIPIIAFDLRTTEETVHRVIDNYELFCKNDTHFFSNSVLKRLEMRNEKSEKAKISANARWNNANAMRTHSESNAIKENKIKENKEKKIKKFIAPTLEEVKEHAISKGRLDLAEKFFTYYDTMGWLDKGGEPVKCWKGRFATWITRNPKPTTSYQPKETPFKRTVNIVEN